MTNKNLLVADTEEGSDATSSQQSNLTTQQEALTEVANLLIRGFVLILIVYVLSLVCLRSRKSWFDAIAARKASFLLKSVVVIVLFAQLPLLYCYIVFGSPINLSERDETYYMTFGWLRPVANIVLLCFGLFADMHVGPRYICLTGAISCFFFDAISAVRVHLYSYQVHDHNAPLGLYTETTLKFYFYRDLISFCLALYVALMTLHLCAVVGWRQPPLIAYQSIVGGETDRLTVLSEQRRIRRIYDFKNGLEEDERLRKKKKEEKRARKHLRALQRAEEGVTSNEDTAGNV